MAITPAVIIDPIIASTAQTTQYTSTDVTTIIDKFTARNYSATAATLSINLVKTGTAASSTNLVVSRTLQPGETYTFPELVGHTLAVGDFISTIAGTATSISIRASGRKITQ